MSAVVREERKVVSVLFCDLVGFTAASEQADPEDVRARLRPYHAQLQQVIKSHGGTVEKFVGNAVVACCPCSTPASIRPSIAGRKRSWASAAKCPRSVPSPLAVPQPGAVSAPP